MLELQRSIRDDLYVFALTYAKEIAEECNFDQTQLLNNLSACYADSGFLEKAIETGLKLENLLENCNDHVKQIACYINLGNAYLLINDNAKSFSYFQKADDLAIEYKQEDRYYDIKYQYAIVLIKEDLPDKAIPYIKFALDKAVMHKKHADQEKYLKILAECYHLTEQYGLAYNTLLEAFAIHEKISDEATSDKIAKYQARLEVDHKLKEKEQLMIIYARQAEMGQMISAIAHQWKQPLNALSIILDAIQDDWDFNELNQESLNNKITSCKELIFSMNSTINDFRSFFQEKQDYDVFNIREVMEKAVRFTEYRFRQENISMDFSVRDECLLNGSSNQLLQVVLIILNNAFDAFKNNKNKKRSVSFIHKIANNQSQIIITDNAGGIPEKVMEKIFISHFSTKSVNENSGIGLYLAKMIIEYKFKGEISVFNDNEGAVFSIKIPLPENTAKINVNDPNSV